MGLCFERNEFWHRLGGEALVMIPSTQMNLEIIAPNAWNLLPIVYSYTHICIRTHYFQRLFDLFQISINLNFCLVTKGILLNPWNRISKGCVRLGNPDLDFENLNPDFPIEREIRKRISPPRNPFSGWISIKKSKSRFRLGNPKKDLQNCSREQRPFFANYACACKTAVLKNSFSNPFADFPIER